MVLHNKNWTLRMMYTVVADAPKKQPAATIKGSGQKTDDQVLRIVLDGSHVPHNRKPIHGMEHNIFFKLYWVSKQNLLEMVCVNCRLI